MSLINDHTVRIDSGSVAVSAVCLFAAVLKSVNRAPAVLPALVTIWTESITSSSMSSVSPTPYFSLWHSGCGTSYSWGHLAANRLADCHCDVISDLRLLRLKQVKQSSQRAECILKTKTSCDLKILLYTVISIERFWKTLIVNTELLHFNPCIVTCIFDNILSYSLDCAVYMVLIWGLTTVFPVLTWGYYCVQWTPREENLSYAAILS